MFRRTGIQGPKGDDGPQVFKYDDPAGDQGLAGNDMNSFRWTINNGSSGYGQFSSGQASVRTTSGYTTNKYGLYAFWINEKDVYGTQVGSGQNNTSNRPTGWFGLWDAGDILTIRNVENEGDYGIYQVRSLIWRYSSTYSSYVEVQVEPITGVVILGPTSWSINKTYSFSFAKKGRDGDSQSLGLSDDITCRSLGAGTNASGLNGDIRAAGNVTAYYSSDSRLKENIKNIQNPIGKILSLNGVTFDWTKEYIENNGGEDKVFMRKKDIGVIAQEVNKVMPEIVTTREDGYLAIKYDRLTPLLIEAIKTLTKKVSNLENEINELKNKE